MQTRIITALIFGIVVLAVIWLGRVYIPWLLLVIAIGCAFEYERTVHTRFLFIYPGLSIISFGVVFLFLPSDYILYPIVIGCLTGFILIYWVFKTHNFFNHRRYGALINIFYIGMSCGLLAKQLYFTENPRILFLSILIGIWLSDSGAYLIGSTLGKTKLLPRISPKKTVEGFFGALLFVLIGVILIQLYFWERSWAFWIIFGVTIWIFGALGDLVQSSVKRKYGRKDSGSFLPGHGGFWDRFDSLLLVTPFILLLIKIWK